MNEDENDDYQTYFGGDEGLESMYEPLPIPTISLEAMLEGYGFDG